jgi:hypothetical protein
VTDHPHPAPHRHSINFSLLAACLVGVPTLWGLRLVLNYFFDSYFCFPGGDARRPTLPGGLGWVWPTILAIDVLTILFAVGAIVVSYRNWSRTREEYASPHAPLIEIGEGRTRFLSLWGLMIGVGFLIAVLFDFLALWIVPVCG